MDQTFHMSPQTIIYPSYPNSLQKNDSLELNQNVIGINYDSQNSYHSVVYPYSMNITSINYYELFEKPKGFIQEPSNQKKNLFDINLNQYNNKGIIFFCLLIIIYCTLI